MLDETQRWYVPCARRQRALDRVGDTVRVGDIDNSAAEETGVPVRHVTVAGRKKLYVPIEMINGSLAGLQRPDQPDFLRNVTGERNTDLMRRLRHALITFHRHSKNLYQVITGIRPPPHATPGILGSGGIVAADAGRGRVDGGTDQLAVRRLVPKLEVQWTARHAADGSDAVRNVQEQHILSPSAIARSGNVSMHLGESGHEVATGAVDP